MPIELRKSGISVVGDAPWGTHFCHFYEMKQDLLDTLVPYFKAGLESKEFCLWVVSDSELITVEEAKGALAQAVPDLERHISDESIEILNGHDWYFEQHGLNLERAKHGWDAKLKRALARGYEGLRASADTFWLAEKDWKDFFAYEKQVNDWITDQSMTVMCTYPLAKSGATEVLDVVQAHQFAIARRQGEWEVIESPQLIQAKAEIKKLNEDLEQRVIERTNELRVANEELRKEITERNQAEDETRRQKEILQQIVDHIPVMINFVGADGRIKLVNREWERTLGWSLEEIRQQNVDVFAECYPDPHYRQQVLKFVNEAKGQWADFKTRVRDGRVIDTTWVRVHLSDGTSIGIGTDITERKEAEEKLKQSESQLAEAQRLAHVGSWDWDIRSNAVTWSDELYRIFGLEPGKIKTRGDAMPFIHPEDRDLVLNTVKSAVKNREPYSFYYRVLRPDGEERVVHSRGHVLSDEHGEPVRVFGATQDITELKRGEEKLKASSEQLRALSGRLQSVREEEATRIAREIHDELGSALTRLKWDLELLSKERLKTQERVDRENSGQKIDEMIQLVDATVDTVRRISSELRPSILDDLGLAAALRWHTEQFQNRTSIVTDCDCSVENLGLNQEQSTAVFRIFEEALTNVMRHAGATKVDVRLEKGKGDLVVTIRDNGRGITEAQQLDPLSLGLLGMRERVNLIGGEISITGIAGEGTLVTVRLPISGKH